MRLLPGEEHKMDVPFEGDQQPLMIRSTTSEEDPRVTLTSCLFFMSAPVDDFRIKTLQGRTTVELHRAGAPPLLVNDVPSPILPAPAKYRDS